MQIGISAYTGNLKQNGKQCKSRWLIMSHLISGLTLFAQVSVLVCRDERVKKVSFQRSLTLSKLNFQQISFYFLSFMFYDDDDDNEFKLQDASTHESHVKAVY